MKQIAINLYIGILLVLLSLNLSAQETDDSYIPLINKQGNQTWIWDSYRGEGPRSYNRVTLTNQDSVINGVSYNVFHNYRYDYWYNYRPDTIIENDLLLREENKKVFVYLYGAERLLYDFSLKIGDTVTSDDHIYLKVISIDTTNFVINGQNCRKWSFDYYLGDIGTYFPGMIEWIEGIGCTKGLVYDVELLIIADNNWNGNLRCYEYEGELVYHNSDWNDGCENHLGIKGIEDDELVLFPNPAKEDITLTATEDIFIFNSLGQRVKYIPTPKGETIISISELPKGIYYLKSGNKRQKLIKE